MHFAVLFAKVTRFTYKSILILEFLLTAQVYEICLIIVAAMCRAQYYKVRKLFQPCDGLKDSQELQKYQCKMKRGVGNKKSFKALNH